MGDAFLVVSGIIIGIVLMMGVHIYLAAWDYVSDQKKRE